MSISEVQRLQGLVPVSSIGKGDAKSAASRDAISAEAPQARQAGPGVNVEVVAKLDAGDPPVASERVAEIRAALKDGSYPLVPTKIADAMIAARISVGLGQ